MLTRKDGSIWARVTYVDASGKRRERAKKANNRSHAKQLIRDLLAEIDDLGPQAFEGATMTFAELAQYYETNYLKAPVYREGRKVAGMRSWQNLKSMLKPAKEHFGKKRIRAITFGDLERLKNKRLESKTRYDTPRAIATVNRELSQLRKIFNVAERNGWIRKSPFKAGGVLISIADEKARERILTREEETRLLAACTGRRAHLRTILICALDTGMRRGEILRLRWQDIDFERGIIKVEGMHTKTLRAREVPLTKRLALELQELWKKSPRQPERRCFGIVSNFKRSFAGVCKDAMVEGFRFHDARHTAATRMLQKEMKLEEVGRILGHTQAQTTYRYINVDTSTVRRAADALNDFNRESEEREGKRPHLN